MTDFNMLNSTINFYLIKLTIIVAIVVIVVASSAAADQSLIYSYFFKPGLKRNYRLNFHSY